jgi:hypothetical protein
MEQISAGCVPLPASSVLPRLRRVESNLSFSPAGARLMKRALIGVNGVRAAAARGARSTLSTNACKEKHMTSKKQSAVRKPTKKIADPRRVRYGAGMAPATVRSRDMETQDGGKVRFGAGMAPASLRK